MRSKKPHRPSPNERTMRPVFLIFCEGITEENYIHMLQQLYRAQIRVITHVEGQSICQNIIRKHKEKIRLKPNEVVETFLMYDLDVEEVNKKLLECDAVPLFSNPCVELWFLLHSKDQKTTNENLENRFGTSKKNELIESSEENSNKRKRKPANNSGF